MSAELLTELESQGVKITAEGDRLKIKAPKGTITEKLRQRLTAHKPEIIAALSMAARPELARICHRAVADYPDVDADHLMAFLIEAQDAQWETERIARHLARRMAEGMIR